MQSSSELQPGIRLQLPNMLREVMNQVAALLEFPISYHLPFGRLQPSECQLPTGFAGGREVLPSPAENCCIEGRERASPCKCQPEVGKRDRETPLDLVIHKTFMKVNDCPGRD